MSNRLKKSRKSQRLRVFGPKTATDHGTFGAAIRSEGRTADAIQAARVFLRVFGAFFSLLPLFYTFDDFLVVILLILTNDKYLETEEVQCRGNGSSCILRLPFGICHASISLAKRTNVAGVIYILNLFVRRLDGVNRLPI